MAHPNATDTLLDDFSNLPIHPTGSGIADLEMAYEQMKLAENADASNALDLAGSRAQTENLGTDTTGMETEAVEESAAHPS
jgi:hypothetical protein